MRLRLMCASAFRLIRALESQSLVKSPSVFTLAAELCNDSVGLL